MRYATPAKRLDKFRHVPVVTFLSRGLLRKRDGPAEHRSTVLAGTVAN
jgi:hypothetical protein